MAATRKHYEDVHKWIKQVIVSCDEKYIDF